MRLKLLPRHFYLLVVSFFFSSMLISCKDDIAYSKFLSVPDQHWTYQDTIRHIIPLKDSTGVYDVFLMVRFRKDYEFSNLWLKTRHNMYGKDTTERVEVILFNRDGSPRGKVFGNNSTVEGVWKSKVHLNDSLYINLVQDMRKNPLPAIMDVGVKVMKVK